DQLHPEAAQPPRQGALSPSPTAAPARQALLVRERRMIMSRDPEFACRPLEWFKEHPRQAALFGDLPKGELDALVKDLDAKGQRVPVEALPDGTLVAGHQRLHAARQLGWTELDVKIRHDLVGAAPEKVEAEMIDDNYCRRQLSPLLKARCCLRRVQIESGGRALRAVAAEGKAGAAPPPHPSVRSLHPCPLVARGPPANPPA